VRRLARLGLAVVVVAGSFVVCAGIPAGVLWLITQLGWTFLPSLLVGAVLGPGGMVAVGGLLARAERRRVALGDPLPDGPARGSVLLEASMVLALLATAIAIIALLVFGSHGGGSLGPFPD